MKQQNAWSSLLGGLVGLEDSDEGEGDVLEARDAGSELGKDPSAATAAFAANKGDQDNLNEDDGDELVLGDSTSLTAPTTEESGSVLSSDDDPFAPSASSWLLGGLGSDLKSLAVSLKETAGGVVGFVQRSALSVAAEIAELEDDYNEIHHHRESDGSSVDTLASLRLPWEVLSETGEYFEDLELRRQIFQLSAGESTFFTPFASNNSQAPDDPGAPAFVLDEPRICLIRRLLQLDDGLAATHARLSGRSQVRESLFWQNYFHHCEETRLAHERTRSHPAREQPLQQQDWRHPDDGAVLLPSASDAPATPTTRSRTKSDDDQSYVCVSSQPDVLSPPSSLNWSTALSEVDLVILDNLDKTAIDDDPQGPR